MKPKIDERFAQPELLEYNIICHKCGKLPMGCGCWDKWFRLRAFKIRLATARLNIVLGCGESSEEKLIDKFGI